MTDEANTLDLFKTAMLGVGATLAQLCESMDGIEAINVYGDNSDGMPYASVTAYDSNKNVVLRFTQLWGDDNG